ncbi:MAG: hypothetical protein ACOYXC_21665 [Candidatus Rifleibacteriota bacterium]
MSDLFGRLLAELSPELQAIGMKAINSGLPAKKLIRVVPQKTLSVSLSGLSCEQNCAHCNGHYLSGMTDLKKLSQIDLSGYNSLLISGGSNREGAVPLVEHAEIISNLPDHLELNVHPGFQPVSQLLFLKKRKTTVSFDLPVSDRVIQQVFRLKHRVEDYRKLLNDYLNHFQTIPHVTIGLDPEGQDHEMDSFDFLSHQAIKKAVIIVFRPTPGTELHLQQVPSVEKAIEVVAHAIKVLKCPVSIGCMRPAGIYRKEFDILAWLHGCEAFVQPDHRLLEVLEEFHIDVSKKHDCCCL